MTSLSKLAPNTRLGLSRLLYTGAGLAYLGGVLYRWKKQHRAKKDVKKPKKEPRKTRLGPGVDGKFLSQLRELLRVMIPGLWSVEAGLLSLHTLVLVIRTFLSIYVAKLEGRMVRQIVRKDVGRFVLLLTAWFGVAIPATFVNSLIRYLESHLALAFRSRLLEKAYQRYLSNQTYYRVSNLDCRLENPDHCLTDDVTSFTSACAHLYSHLTKPTLDAVIISLSLYQLAKQQQSNTSAGPLIAALVVFSTGRILRLISPKFGEMVADEAAKKGSLRSIHSRIITNAEEIAFYDGHKVELDNLRSARLGVDTATKRILTKKLWYIMLEQFLMKYVWAGSGMIMIAIPIITSGTQDVQAGEGAVSTRTEYYTTAKSLLTGGADAMERLMSAYKEIVELAGYTQRVSMMMEVFQDCADNKYTRPAVTQISSKLPMKEGHLVVSGQVIESYDGNLVLEDVPIVTPNGEVVVDSLSLKVSSGQHVFISGPNGCGKSSLFRVLSGLWPLYSGSLQRPPSHLMVFVPQRPLMGLGTLRDQVIYPDRKEDMVRKGWSDTGLKQVLDIVSLAYLLPREGGWDTTADWKDILSGGEKQRMGLARLFYHRPQWALLDECTSAVSIDVEGKIYQAAKDLGVTLLTITHRPTLAKYHTHLLQFDGEGGWTFSTFSSEVYCGLEEERDQLEEKLAQVPRIEERLREIRNVIGGGMETE